MPVLELEDVYSGYGDTEILHGVSANVGAGEIVVIIGPNGAGKSTLIKTVIGILTPSKGSVRFQGEDITGWRPEDLVTRGLAYVPQNRNVFPTLTVLENIQMGAITRRPSLASKLTDMALRRMSSRAATPPPMTDPEFDARVDWILDVFPNLRPRLHERAGSLSGGEQQMVALGKALVLDPQLLLVDEPSAGLAPKLVTLMFERIREINRRGTAILLVEQNARRALAMANRGYVLEMGRNRFEGKGEALLTNPDVGRLYLGG